MNTEKNKYVCEICQESHEEKMHFIAARNLEKIARRNSGLTGARE